ncbi:hypothetical protein GGI04_002125 [Coemansia thaxteri]|nr:hypothetical protein GGI04_002125 [Coemansia thaxteri]KAJ2471307.1 hypothetical protein GGI02_002359 [Coemansia sp. RSA 2322]
MGLIKKIKNSYVFTQFEVGKYTKRRNGGGGSGGSSSGSKGPGTPRSAGGSEFISAFDEVADEIQASSSVSTLGRGDRVQRAGSSAELAVGYTSTASTAASTPQASPFEGGGGVRARPAGARAARSTMDMQSVYFAPGRNVAAASAKRQSVYPGEVPRFDKQSASSVDYYVFTPTRRDLAALPLDARRRTTRGVVAPDEKPSPDLHRDDFASTNPFVERRRKAHVAAASPPVPASAVPARKYLTTPVYANQSGTTGLDLLA